MGRNTKKSQVTETAEELFMKFGMKRVTVKEICEKAGVSKMTFYNHFDNKNDIIKYIFNSWLDEGYRWLEELEKQNLSFREEIQKILEYKKSYTSRMSPQFIDEYLKDSPELEDFFENYRQRGVESFIDWIESCKEKGKVRKTIKSEFLVHVFNMVFNLVKDEQLRSLYPNISDLIEDIFEFIFYGIVPEQNKENSNAK